MINDCAADKLFQNSPFGDKLKRYISSQFIPQYKKQKLKTSSATFCNIYSKDGDKLLVSDQKLLYLYNANTLKLNKKIRSKDTRYSILSTDFSNDGQWIAYSSWSDYVHICNAEGNYEVHEPLLFNTDRSDHFCLFSIKFSHDSREIIGGSRNYSVFVYDVERKTKLNQIEAHADDVNAVCFLDNSCQVIVSGSDDNLCKLWDRRVSSDDSKPIGALKGHLNGISYLDSKGDGIHFISNSKDHTVKLWDMRKMIPEEEAVPFFSGDIGHLSDSSKDCSIMTYTYHYVIKTLIRCKFSPLHTTGQMYIYCGSYDGIIRIYDVLTGNVVKELVDHGNLIRDVDWHPYKNEMVSSSWSGYSTRWVYDS